jgi:hypothetical protein
MFTGCSAQSLVFKDSNSNLSQYQFGKLAQVKGERAFEQIRRTPEELYWTEAAREFIEDRAGLGFIAPIGR